MYTIYNGIHVYTCYFMLMLNYYFGDKFINLSIVTER